MKIPIFTPLGENSRLGFVGVAMSASTGELFENLPIPAMVSAPLESPKASPRVLRPSRDQLQLHPCDLESSLAEDHPARLAWG